MCLEPFVDFLNIPAQIPVTCSKMHSVLLISAIISVDCFPGPRHCPRHFTQQPLKMGISAPFYLLSNSKVCYLARHHRTGILATSLSSISPLNTAVSWGRSRTRYQNTGQLSLNEVEFFASPVAVVFVWPIKHVWPFATPWTAARQASLSFTVS